MSKMKKIIVCIILLIIALTKCEGLKNDLDYYFNTDHLTFK